MKAIATSTIFTLLLGFDIVLVEHASAEEKALDFSPTKEFAKTIGHHDECYLVCVYSAKVEPRADGLLGKRRGWEQIVFDGTVVRVIKGASKVGDTFNFIRVSDGKAGDASKTLGRLYFVFRSKSTDGTMCIDIQDPMVMWPYSKELAKVAFTKQAQQGAAPDG